MLRDGEAIVNKPGASLESRAWYFALALSFTPTVSKALALLDGMQKEAPDDPWTLAAEAILTSDFEQAIARCDKVAEKTDRDDALFLCGRALKNKLGRTEVKEKGELLKAFLERHSKRFGSSSDGLAVKAALLCGLYGRIDKSKLDDCTFFDAALQMDPHNVGALIGKVQLLANANRPRAAVDLIEQSPWTADCHEVHWCYWVAIKDREDLDNEEKASLIDADVRVMLAHIEPTSEAFSQAWAILKDLAPSRLEGMGDFALERHPNAGISEAVTMWRLRDALGGDIESATPELRKQVVSKLIDFLSQPGRKEPDVEGHAFYLLSRLVSSAKDLTPAQILAMTGAIEQDDLVSPYQSDTVNLVVALASRKANLEELAKAAEKRIDGLARELATQGAGWHYELAKFAVAGYSATLASWYDALGWVKLQQGHVDQAESKLVTAETLLNQPARQGKSNLDYQPVTLMHLGSLYTAKGDYAKAEQYLLRALGADYREKDEHPALAAYRGWYLRKHGNAGGMDAYLAGANEKNRARQKEMVIKSRIANPKPVAPFTLETIDGKTISSDSLKGKVVVINFWGVWCGFCVKEMPEFQQLYEKYKDDPKVAVLAIDSKDTVEQVKVFLEKKKYTFPVLMEGNYLEKAEIAGFPTTWFLDLEGRKVFETTGFSAQLLEEFSWRVESLRENQAAT